MSTGRPAWSSTTSILLDADVIDRFFGQRASDFFQTACCRFQIQNPKDLTNFLTLFRPGPLGWLDEFIRCRTGARKMRKRLPDVDTILSETHGIMPYQDQILRTIQTVLNLHYRSALPR